MVVKAFTEVMGEGKREETPDSPAWCTIIEDEENGRRSSPTRRKLTKDVKLEEEEAGGGRGGVEVKAVEKKVMTVEVPQMKSLLMLSFLVGHKVVAVMKPKGDDCC